MRPGCSVLAGTPVRAGGEVKVQYFLAMGVGDSGAGSEGKRTDVIASVANALQLLELFTEAPTIQVGAASERLGLSRSTIHRLLTTLGAYGYIEHDVEAREYLPGAVLTSIGLVAVRSSDVRAVGQNALTKLAAQTDETAHLSVLRGQTILCIDSIESSQSVRTGSRVGWTLPAHATAAGRVLLAELPDDEVMKIYPHEAIGKTGKTPGLRRVDLLAELELVRARRYATNFGESEPDVSAVAVVLRDWQDRARAAVSVTSPRSRGDEEWMRNTGRVALDVADEFRGAIN